MRKKKESKGGKRVREKANNLERVCKKRVNNFREYFRLLGQLHKFHEFSVQGNMWDDVARVTVRT